MKSRINTIKTVFRSGLIFLITTSFGCSTVSMKEFLKTDDTVFLGVDPLVYAKADSMADRLFVSYQTRLQADSLTGLAKNYYEDADSLWSKIIRQKQLVFPDSLDITTDKGKLVLEGIQYDSLRHALIKHTSQVLLSEAIDRLEEARQTDPFNQETKSWLAAAFNSRGEKLKETEDFTKTVNILESLIIMNKGDYELYERLGDNYSQLKDWNNAYNSYKMAHKVLLQTAFLQKDHPDILKNTARDSVNKKLLFDYMFQLGSTQARLHEPDSSMHYFDRALKLASSRQDSLNVTTYVEWIKWDNHNIAASEQWDTLRALEDTHQYVKAYDGYKELLTKLKTEKAKKWVIHRIALIEFYYRDEKEQATERLLTLINSLPIDPVTEMPLDSTDQKYFDECGDMYSILAEGYKSNKNYNKAIQALITGASFEWNGRGKCYAELAKLSIHNLEESIKYVDKAFESNYNFSVKERIELKSIQLRAYRRMGPDYNDKARELYDQIKYLQNIGA